MVDPAAVRRAYDDLAETYADRRPADDPATEVLQKFLRDADDPERILDAGCGQGTPVLSAVDRTARAVGVDVSQAQLGLAAETVPAADLTQGDMARLPFEDDAFDAVVAFWSLIHVPLAEHATVVEEFARVLRPGGRVLLSEGTTEWVGSEDGWLDTDVEMGWEIAGADRTRAQLQAAGFDVTEEWRVPEPIDPTDVDEGDDDAELPWTFFAARREA